MYNEDMELVDETVCEPLCQHPTCWSAASRLSRGKPRRKYADSNDSSDSEEETSLPTQKILNLLDDYGEDPHDKYPSRYRGAISHERTSLSALKERHTSRASFPNVPPPRGSPASAPFKTPLPPPSAPTLGKVEVQEVFELDELQKGWQDTFMAKNCYVWVPNPLRESREQPIIDLPTPHHIMKDVTEDLMPPEIELARESSTLRKSRKKSPIRGKNVKTFKEFTEKQTYGVYELLNLPKDVLARLLDQLSESELMKLLPTLEKEQAGNNSLVNSQVLKQRKLELLDGTGQMSRGAPGCQSQQVFLMDEELYREISAKSRSPLAVTRYTQTTPHLWKKPVIPPVQSPPEKKGDSNISDKNAGQSVTTEVKTRIPNISLGLPPIPSGVRHTKPFTYNAVSGFDFTLGPLMTPLPSSKRSTPSPHLSQHSSEKTATTIHVNVPQPQPLTTPASAKVKAPPPTPYSPNVDNMITDGGSPHPHSPTNMNQNQQQARSTSPLRTVALNIPTPEEHEEPALDPIKEEEVITKREPTTRAPLATSKSPIGVDKATGKPVSRGSEKSAAGKESPLGEPWPKVLEEKYTPPKDPDIPNRLLRSRSRDRSPVNRQSSVPARVGLHSRDGISYHGNEGAGQPMETARSSLPPSRESNFSDKAIRTLKDSLPDSPAPPPPSPVAKKELDLLEDIDEADSETTTARGEKSVCKSSISSEKPYQEETDKQKTNTADEDLQKGLPALMEEDTKEDLEKAVQNLVLTAEEQLKEAVYQLDEFDNTEQEYKDELRKEYEKLSESGSK